MHVQKSIKILFRHQQYNMRVPSTIPLSSLPLPCECECGWKLLILIRNKSAASLTHSFNMPHKRQRLWVLLKLFADGSANEFNPLSVPSPLRRNEHKSPRLANWKIKNPKWDKSMISASRLSFCALSFVAGSPTWKKYQFWGAAWCNLHTWGALPPGWRARSRDAPENKRAQVLF